VKELTRRLGETESDLKAFLEYAKAPKISEIPASRYDELDLLLKRKEQRGR
jgi:hypothetical protein